MEKPRLARLTAIMTQLQSKRILTAPELAERHQVSIRTIYRDIRTLEQSGIPVYTIEGKGYAIMPGFHLPPVMFTEAEANALITAEQLVNQNKDKSLIKEYQSAIVKIRALLRQDDQEKASLLAQRIHIRENLEQQRTSNFLMELQKAITGFRVLRLNYLSLDGISTERLVEPFALFQTKENWILIAHCRKRDAFRNFRLDCIQETRTLSEQFEPHPYSLPEYFEICRANFKSTPDIPLTEDKLISP